MIKWYQSELQFDSKPSDLKIWLICTASTSHNMLTANMEIKFERGLETVSVQWKEKKLKIWPPSQVHEIDDQMLKEKFGNWVENFNPGNNLKQFIIRAAAKPKSSMPSWLLSLASIQY